MPRDQHGLEVTAASDAAARAFDAAVLAYVKFRVDATDRTKQALALDPAMPLAHVLRGAFAMMAYKASFAPLALASAEAAAAGPTTAREAAHIKALRVWAEGDVFAATRVWSQILAAHPRDLMALRLHHFAAFWSGRPGEMAAQVEAAAPHFADDDPGYGAMLACRCFAHEECGEHLRAEAYGREAVAIDQADIWATHAVAHIMEMQGRTREGMAWIDGLAGNWDGVNNIRHHVFWHRALYSFEHGDFDAVLRLYDTQFRNLASPLTQAMPDLYVDVQNAASALLRLELRGHDVGARWNELADLAESRVGDTLSAFTLPHWMMALAATGRTEAAQRMLAAVDAAGRGNTPHARLLREVAAPVCRAVLAHRRGDHAEAVASMRPALGELPRLGGSHAQQDILEQLFLDAARKAPSPDDEAAILQRVRARHGVPPERRRGYAA
jgi:tetratricopeptide (TPR) repeat protein